MNKRKCIKEHYISYFEGIGQVGREYKFFDYCIGTYYCHFCNKIRVVRKIYFKKPNFLKKKDDGLPF